LPEQWTHPFLFQGGGGIDGVVRPAQWWRKLSRNSFARSHAYFAGGSNGGRQGLSAAQRFPTEFDGIVIGAPVFRVTHAAIGSAWETIAFTQIAPEDADGRPILGRAYSEART
jgi:pimeloyl-ACP methyl ester carboxylesterase